nr:hypothetical protein Iba_chr15bCG4960 [Ipomoea batatas]GME14816.1 hypothetical protein Iba_scaffold15463CG0040 [Ipomoea batatas]
MFHRQFFAGSEDHSVHAAGAAFSDQILWLDLVEDFVFREAQSIETKAEAPEISGSKSPETFRDFSGEVVLKNQELSQLPLFAHLRRNWPREEILRHVDEPNALIQLPPDFSGKFVIPERELLQELQTANQIKRNRAGEVPARQLDFRDGAIRSARDSGEGAERRIGVPRVEHWKDVSERKTQQSSFVV